MDIPQPLIFLGILLIIPLQIYLSPSKTSDLDYYVAQMKARFSKIWDKLTTIPSEKVGVERSEARVYQDVEVKEEEVEDGFFTGGFYIFLKILIIIMALFR